MCTRKVIEKKQYGEEAEKRSDGLCVCWCCRPSFVYIYICGWGFAVPVDM